jgi:hypothetical protein
MRASACKAAAPPTTQGHATIQGTVVDGPTGHPLRNITVVLTSAVLSDPRSAESDEHGRYRFDGVPAGIYSLVFSTHLGRDAIARNDCVVVNGGTMVPIQARVEPKPSVPELPSCPLPPTWPPPPGRIEGTVRIRGGMELEGVTVVALPADCLGGFYMDWTGRDGRYVLKKVPAGRYNVDFTVGDHVENAVTTVGADVSRLDHDLDAEPVHAELAFQRRMRECGCEREPGWGSSLPHRPARIVAACLRFGFRAFDPAGSFANIGTMSFTRNSFRLPR